MATDITRIADKVRGVAAESRFTQQRIADTLSLSRTSVVDRMNGRVPFTAAEIYILAVVLDVDITRFFPPRLKTPASSDVTSAPSGGAATSVRRAS